MAKQTSQKRTFQQRRIASIIIHITGLLSFAASFSWLPNITNPLHHGFGGSYQFLTTIALTISTLTFTAGFLADVLVNEQLFTLKSILSVCATPLELLVAVLYWGLRAVDKSFVVPPGHEVPFIPDFGWHAMPAIMLTLDLMLLSPPWTITAYHAMALGLPLSFTYLGWLEYCFSRNGWYPYPVLLQLSIWQKLFLCIICAAMMTGSTLVLKRVYGRINGMEELGRPAIKPVKIN